MTGPGRWWEGLGRAISGSRLLAPVGRWARALWPAKKAVRRPAVDPARIELRRLQLLVDDFARKNMTVVYTLRRGEKERWRIAPGGTESLASEEAPAESSG